MEDKGIPDERITASSQHSEMRQGKYARLNLNNCWSAALEDTHPWLQVEIDDKLVQIVGVITQGHPQQEYYVSHYQLQYSIDSTAWSYVSETPSSAPQVRSLIIAKIV